GGAVSVSLSPHGGTTFTLTVPTALSREHVVVIEHAGGLYAFPSHSVRGLLRLADHPWTEVAGGLALRWNGEALPYHSIGDILGLASDEETSALVLDAQGRRVAVR